MGLPCLKQKLLKNSVFEYARFYLPWFPFGSASFQVAITIAITAAIGTEK
jgi:hypothetical protein